MGAGLAAWLAGAGAAEQQAARRAEVTVSYKLWNTSHRPEAVRWAPGQGWPLGRPWRTHE